MATHADAEDPRGEAGIAIQERRFVVLFFFVLDVCDLRPLFFLAKVCVHAHHELIGVSSVGSDKATNVVG